MTLYRSGALPGGDLIGSTRTASQSSFSASKRRDSHTNRSSLGLKGLPVCGILVLPLTSEIPEPAQSRSFASALGPEIVCRSQLVNSVNVATHHNKTLSANAGRHLTSHVEVVSLTHATGFKRTLVFKRLANVFVIDDPRNWMTLCVELGQVQPCYELLNKFIYSDVKRSFDRMRLPTRCVYAYFDISHRSFALSFSHSSCDLLNLAFAHGARAPYQLHAALMNHMIGIRRTSGHTLAFLYCYRTGRTAPLAACHNHHCVPSQDLDPGLTPATDREPQRK